MNKILQVKEQKDITTYLNYSLPLCSFLWNKKKSSWLFEHFTNIYLMHDECGYIWLDYLEELYFPNDILEYGFVHLEKMIKVLDVKHYICERIDLNYYIMIFVDMYYISNFSFYRKYHKINQLFLYGYNLESDEFYGIGFREDNTFGKINYKCNELIIGYKNCLDNHAVFPFWVKEYNIVTMKVKNNDSIYYADVRVILNNMKNYNESVGNKKLLRPEIIIERGETAFFGIKAQNKLVEGFLKLYEGERVLDFRFMYLLVEHKEQMLKKMKYIVAVLGLDKEVRNEISEYQIIVENFSLIKNMYVKNLMLDKSSKTIYDQLKNKEVIMSIYNNLLVLSSKEQKTLDLFISIVDKNI